MTFLKASEVEERRRAILEIIDEELREVKNLSNQYNGKNPELLLRAAELNLEKARLWRDKENEKYFDIPEKDRKKINRRSFFKTSQNYFDRATNVSKQVIRKFPRYRNIADAYYIVGYNYKESNDDKKANRYLTLARQKNPRNDQTKIKSQIAQAEIYYNNRQYRKAIPLYEKSLASLKDRWWTKDSFNLAWCYYRSGNYNKAISKMREIYSRSKDNKYIDMSDQVVRDLGLFYADAGKIEEGIRFYEDLNVDFTKEIVVIGKKLKANNQYTKAEKIFKTALKYEKDPSKQVDIHLQLLETYERHGKNKEHLQTANILLGYYKKGQLDDEQVKKLVYFAQKEAASEQKKVASKAYARAGRVRTAKAIRANQYFDILGEIQPNKLGEIKFLQGETSFAAKRYTSALTFYDASYSLKENHPFKKRALEAMLATLGKSSVKNSIKEQYYDKVYTAYLGQDKTSPKAKKIYMRLFNVKFKKGDLKGAKAVLDNFVIYHKNDYKNQELMIAQLMEKHRKEKNDKAILAWVEAINDNQYKVSKKYADKLREFLTVMQMQKVQDSLEKGKKVFALNGYHKIVADPASTVKSRKNSTYNIAILYYELERHDLAYEWGIKAMMLMNSKEVNKFFDSFFAISNLLFEKRQFAKSSVFSEKLLAHICDSDSKKKNRVFRNSAILAISAGEINRTNQLLAQAQKCKISKDVQNDIRKELAKYFRENKRWRELELTLATIDNDPKEAGYAIIEWNAMNDIYRDYSEISRIEKVNNKIISLYNMAQRKKVDIPLEALDIVAELELEPIRKLSKEVDSIQLTFPEKTYDRLIESRLKKLDLLTKKAAAMQKIGSGEGVVKAYLLLIDSYKKLADEVDNFTPPGKSETYVTSFKKAMDDIAKPIRQTAYKYRSEVMQTITKNQILSRETADILEDTFVIRYQPEDKNFLLMDRRGKH